MKQMSRRLQATVVSIPIIAIAVLAVVKFVNYAPAIRAAGNYTEFCALSAMCAVLFVGVWVMLVYIILTHEND